MITHWDEVEGTARARAHRGYVAGADGLTTRSPPACSASRSSRAVGRRRSISRARRRRSSTSSPGRASPYQAEGDEGARRSRSAPATASSICALEHAHTIGAGDDGLVVLAFGQRHYAANTLLPRAGVSWLGPTWVLEGAPEDHPWAREAAVGAPELDRARRASGARSSTSPMCRRERAPEHDRRHASAAISARPSDPSARGSRTTSCRPAS